jgi:hypothetical protein
MSKDVTHTWQRMRYTLAKGCGTRLPKDVAHTCQRCGTNNVALTCQRTCYIHVKGRGTYMSKDVSRMSKVVAHTCQEFGTHMPMHVAYTCQSMWHTNAKNLAHTCQIMWHTPVILCGTQLSAFGTYMSKDVCPGTLPQFHWGVLTKQVDRNSLNRLGSLYG